MAAGLVIRARHRGATVSVPPADAGALEVELSGCAAVLEGPACELPDDGAVRVWVRAKPDLVTFTPPVATTVLRDVEGGTLLRIVVPRDVTELHIEAKDGRAAGTMRLAPKSVPPWVADAKAARQKGEREAAMAIVRSHEQPTSPKADRAFALGLRARLELAAGHADASFSLFRESARLHRELGRISDAADDSFALAFALNQRSHRYGEARAVLDDVRGWSAAYPDGRVREAYYRGTLALETGDARSALALLRDARTHAARLGLAVLERNAINAYALELELLGRVDEALDLLRALARDAEAAPDASPCEKVEIAINLGYGAVLRREQTGRADAVDSALESALERAASTTACPDKYLRTAALGNFALAALQRGEPAVARTRLERARADVGEARAVEVLFWHDLEGRIALAENEPKRALAAFEEEARLAAATLAFEAEWRAAVGTGEALERLGRNEAALESYRLAEARLTAVSFLVPLGEGRGTFVGDRAKSARLEIDLLVRLGRADEALAVARSSRARVVAGLARTARVESFAPAARARWEDALGAYRASRAALDAEAKDDWKLSRNEATRAREAREKREQDLRAALDATFAAVAESNASTRLSALPADAITLAFHPVRRGWVGLVADGHTVRSFALERLPTKEEEARALLGPLRAKLDPSKRLRVLAYAELRAIDFHALLLDGEPLVATLPVEYPLDLQRRSGSHEAVAEGIKPIALVVTDPTLDLESARIENEHVVRALRDRARWEVTVLDGPRATSAAVTAALPRAELLHYAGHGVFAGREGWHSALPLAGGGHLTIGDVLAAPAVPARVVLSGCETARTASDAPAESLGLAQSFVVAGASFVIAPVRPVDDTLAARMSAALYGAMANEGVVDAAAILRDAQLRLRREDGAVDWSAFRVVSE